MNPTRNASTTGCAARPESGDCGELGALGDSKGTRSCPSAVTRASNGTR
jgi:hypothetical protein